MTKTTDHAVSRRTFVLGAGVAAAGSASGLSAQSAAPPACNVVGSGATFVLVHGSWVGASTFKDLDRRLTARGHIVYRPSLSGWGERAHFVTPDINVSTNVADVQALIEMEDLNDVILVGHSYGGMVITHVAEIIPQRLAALVYLDAVLPENGQSVAAFGGAQQLAETRALKESGAHLVPPPTFLTAVAPNPEVFTPVPIETHLQGLPVTGRYEDVPSKTYVAAANMPPPMFRNVRERLQGAPGWTTHTVPTGHEVFLEAPERTVEILEAAI